MKRLLVALLALGLICAFAMPAGATDIKFNGLYYVEGWYSANPRLEEDNSSSAWYNQRMRINTVFQVSTGLSLTTRFDVMEGAWKGANSVYDKNGNVYADSFANNALAESDIDFDFLYLSFNTKCGAIHVGQMSDGIFGTPFGNGEIALPKIGWNLPFGGGKFLNVFQLKKYDDSEYINAKNNVRYESDAQMAGYMDIIFYFDKTTEAAFLYQYTPSSAESG
ncbi:MAG: hypothetical protein RBS82_10435, partial [Syntrophales bacterium]|nr:hypothetical protein [Syntrophales bacterium]